MSKIIGYPLGFIMWLFYQVFNNYAIALVLFTIVVRLLLFPLSVKQQKSTAAMQAMQPKLDKIKKQYANNQQKMQEEQMKIYSEEGINPMASCLPLLIQMPILYGIFDVVNRPITHILRFSSEVIDWAKAITVDFYTNNPLTGVSAQTISQRVELYILKLVKAEPQLFMENPDFATKVSEFKNTLFGFINLGDIPSFKPEVWTASAVGLVCIAIASGVIQLIMTIYTQRSTKKMNPEGSSAPNMAGMNMMMYMFPLLSVWISMTCPGGLGFYWAVSALIGLAQAVILRQIYTPEYVQKLVEKDKEKRKHKNKSRSGIMQRYQDMVEQQNATNKVTTDKIESNKKLIEAGISSDDIEDVPEVKLSKSKQKEYESAIIAEARRKQAEKYGEEYSDD